MSPETPPPADHGAEEHSWKDDRFGAEAAAAVDAALATLASPDDALRVLDLTKRAGAGFAAFLLLSDTDAAADDLDEKFSTAYVDAWEDFSHFRRDVLDGLGWLDAVNDVMKTQGIPEDHLIWNTAAIDIQIFDTYDLVRLDGWWHVFNK